MIGFSAGKSTRRRHRAGASLVRVLPAALGGDPPRSRRPPPAPSRSVRGAPPSPRSGSTVPPPMAARSRAPTASSCSSPRPARAPSAAPPIRTTSGRSSGPASTPRGVRPCTCRRRSTRPPPTSARRRSPASACTSVSARAGGCGAAGDIYRTRNHPVEGWLAPTHLGCQASGWPELRRRRVQPLDRRDRGRDVPVLLEPRRRWRHRPGHLRQPDARPTGRSGRAARSPGLNTAANDQMPNVSRDGREIVFSSDRPGTLGAMDVYRSTRSSATGAWSAPVNVGPTVNTAAAETRAVAVR